MLLPSSLPTPSHIAAPLMLASLLPPSSSLYHSRASATTTAIDHPNRCLLPLLLSTAIVTIDRPNRCPHLLPLLPSAIAVPLNSCASATTATAFTTVVPPLPQPHPSSSAIALSSTSSCHPCHLYHHCPSLLVTSSLMISSPMYPPMLPSIAPHPAVTPTIAVAPSIISYRQPPPPPVAHAAAATANVGAALFFLHHYRCFPLPNASPAPTLLMPRPSLNKTKSRFP
ncbi:hypothetical protein B296_00006603 [Ensete ventricosum]|uniref:Uncharacterized protein n=1 Tax=Ensete ventricosum TaxID=4639 RepID=A0A426YL89_ENSVE|nr:hypothetical protein B296_00006603 [Ensete ventricosum]